MSSSSSITDESKIRWSIESYLSFIFLFSLNYFHVTKVWLSCKKVTRSIFVTTFRLTWGFDFFWRFCYQWNALTSFVCHVYSPLCDTFSCRQNSALMIQWLFSLALLLSPDLFLWFEPNGIQYLMCHEVQTDTHTRRAISFLTTDHNIIGYNLRAHRSVARSATFLRES